MQHNLSWTLNLPLENMELILPDTDTGSPVPQAVFPGVSTGLRGQSSLDSYAGTAPYSAWVSYFPP